MEKRKEGDIMSCSVLDAAIEKGRNLGLEEGKKDFIRTLILDHIEEGITKKRTLEKLQTKWGLSKEEAEKEYEQVLAGDTLV